MTSYTITVSDAVPLKYYCFIVAFCNLFVKQQKCRNVCPRCILVSGRKQGCSQTAVSIGVDRRCQLGSGHSVGGMSPEAESFSLCPQCQSRSSTALQFS